MSEDWVTGDGHQVGMMAEWDTVDEDGRASSDAPRPAPDGGEHVLVCIDEHPACAGLVRSARRLADRLNARWTALYIETTRHRRLREEERDRIADCLRVAQKFGGQAMTLPGGRISETILTFAQENGVTQIVVGKFKRIGWLDRLRRSIARDLVKKAGDIGLHVMPEEGEYDPPAAAVATASPARSFNPLPYLLGIGLLAAATALGDAFRDYVKVSEIALTYITLVLITAVRFGLMPALVLSAAAMLAFDFFWLPPFYTLAIEDPRDWVALLFLIAVFVLTSHLAARTSAQILIARSHAKTTAELYSFSRQLSAIANLDVLLHATTYQIGTILRARVVVLLPEGGRLVTRAGYPSQSPLGEADLAAATWAWHNERPAGHGAAMLGSGERLFLPLRTPRGNVALLGIARDARHSLLTAEERRLLDALADQAAVAIERITLAAEIDETKVLRETERLRSALLTSISHDLRTPLASVLAALTSLRRDALDDPEARNELLDTAQEEAERLNRFVGNLLDITRLEAGALEIKRDVIDLADVVGSAVRRARKLLGARKVKIELSDDLPMVQLDFVLFEHVLFNLLDNAGKYSPPDSTVSIQALSSEGSITLRIGDEGPGIPVEDLDRIFDKFYRLKTSDRQRAGTGLGLAICRGFVEAQGGTITAGNRKGRSGSVFTIRLPADNETMATKPSTAPGPANRLPEADIQRPAR